MNDTVLSIIFFFVIFSFLGWYLEYINEFIFCREKGVEVTPNYSILFFKEKGKIPMLPVYGVGLFILYYITVTWFNTPSFNRQGMLKKIVIIGVIVSVLLSLFELISGVVAEYIFKRRLWDYRKNPGNYLGYIDLLHSLAWFLLGVASVFIIKFSGIKIW